MKLTIRNQVQLAACCLFFGTSVLNTSCNKTKDLYQENLQEEESENIFSSTKIPENFKWETLKNIDISLNVDDKFDGKYYYSLQVFDSDPRDGKAALLDAGYVKKREPWISKATVSSALNELYIKETTPLNEINYYIIKIVNNKLSDINRQSIQTLSKNASLPSGLKANTVNTKTPQDAFLGDIVLSPITYSFEDSWPYMGDYDLNDCVLEIQIIKHIDHFNMLNGVTLKTKVLAVGAKRRLAAAIKINDFMSNEIFTASYSNPDWTKKHFALNANGIEIGQNLPVLPIADDLHSIFGLTETGIINTINDDFRFPILPIVETSIHIKLYRIPYFGYYSISPFIINNFDHQNGTRNEIHLPGEYPTKKADPVYLASKSLKPSDSFLTKTNTPFAVSVPSPFKYPTEAVRIDRAYNNFLSWATSGGNVNHDWYKYFNEGLVFSK